MAREMVAYCDVCKKPNAIEWNVTRAVDGHWIIDLCEEHAEAVLDIVKHGRHVERVRPARAGRTRYSAYVRGVPPVGTTS